MPRRRTGNSHDWTRSKLITHLQLNDDEFDECRDFLKKFLTESGLLGKKIRASSNELQYSLMETIRTKAHSDIPRAIINGSASADGMRGLVGFSMKINNDLKKGMYTGRKRGRRSQQSRNADPSTSTQLPGEKEADETSSRLQRPDLPTLHPEPSSSTGTQEQIQTSHQAPLLEDCTIHVFNMAYRDQNTSTTVTQVLKDGASQPITVQDLDFDRWKDILRTDCWFDEAHHLLACALVAIPEPFCLPVLDEWSWHYAISNMTNAGSHCIFWMVLLGSPPHWDFQEFAS
ncbi:hypothetical protein V8E54_001861 [Elaphomyces granulatus]